jgi:hypothetical protein
MQALTFTVLIDTLHSQHNFSVALAAQLATLKDTVEDLKQGWNWFFFY